MGEVGGQRRSVLLLACGALSRELLALKRLGGWDCITIECLPALLHNTPEKIPEAVGAKLEEVKDSYDEVFVAYADCGTGGRLDTVLDKYGVKRLPGAHCYEFFAGAERFAEIHEGEIGTFYLTDFMVRQFDSIVIHGLGLDRHPELRSVYFENYRRVVYLAQTDAPELTAKARKCAEKLGLDFETCFTGLDPINQALPIESIRSETLEDSR
ncbi:MAG: DUF1638 domain-containing protein [Deltaproteobacteria bacterium]|nr:DUF1638 domain-containing protein [Deltaproteobacteria bacterium]